VGESLSTAANGKPKKLNLARALLLLTRTAEASAVRRQVRRALSPKPLREFAYSMASALPFFRDRFALVESIVMGTSNAAAIISLANEADDYEEGPGIAVAPISERRSSEWAFVVLIDACRFDRLDGMLIVASFGFVERWLLDSWRRSFSRQVP
jgi:hypothetical protein